MSDQTHPPESNVVDDERHGPDMPRLVNAGGSTPCDSAKDQDSAVTRLTDDVEKRIAHHQDIDAAAQRMFCDFFKEPASAWDETSVSNRIEWRTEVYKERLDAAIKRAEAAEAREAVLLDTLLFAERSLTLADGLGRAEGGFSTPRSVTVGEAITAAKDSAPQAQALLDRVRGLEDALRPFAEAAKRYNDAGWKGDYSIDMSELVTVADLRRAASALSKSAAGV